MGKILRHTLVVLSFVCCAAMQGALAQAVADTSIVQYLERANTGGLVTVTQPEQLSQRVARSGGSVSSTVSMPLYHLQLFSSNLPTAKTQAHRLAEDVFELFPDLVTKVSFTAPYWRLRAGEFQTYEEAYAMQLMIEANIPALSRGILIIRERVDIPVRNYSNY